MVPSTNVLDYDGIATLDAMLESRVLLLRSILPVGRPIYQDGEFAGLGWPHYVGAKNHTVTHGHADVFLQNKMRLRVRGVLPGYDNGNCRYQNQSPEFHRALRLTGCRCGGKSRHVP